ncbi:MAG: right-handed parallel beta-helix repeat-containing protein [Polyangiaceae bacterium]|nr:right-handed parallel beta-helix repeat-containing protein [Polyangiaceae bacterium]
MKVRFGCVSAFATLLVSPLALAQDATSAGNLSAPYPTFENLSLVWEIAGDDNLNSRVGVRYRKKGDTQFRDALDLYRIPAGQNEGFSWTNKHAGSVWGLTPGTEYDVELTLTDPDGGNASEVLAVSTRAIPQVASGGASFDATPNTIDSILAGSVPGDRIFLADGVYAEIVIPNDGSEGAPIVLQAKNPGGAVIQGDVRIDGRSHVIVENLTVQGKIKFNDASNIVVRGCTIETNADGIVSYGSGLTNGWIVDNTISGPTEWKESALGVSGDNLGEGIQVTGPGNVIAFNKVKGFRDCISLLEDGEAVNQISVDIYGNDLEACADDAIEADFAMGNVRVYHNRIAHSFMGISSQPSLGGPTYFVRNVLYNIVYQAFKLQRTSSGDVGFHNTIIKSGDAFSVNTDTPIYRAHFLNNLFLGGPGATYNGYDSGPGKVVYLPSADPSSIFNYNGYGSESGQISGQIGSTKFASFSELTSLTSEKNATLVGLDTFGASIVYPSEPFTSPQVPSFALAPSGSAVDKGTNLPNVNDGFAGKAPDLGALELGQPEPVYGPGGVIGTGGGGTGGSGGSGNGGSSIGGSGGGQAIGGTGGSAGETPGSNGCSCRVATNSGDETTMGRSATWMFLVALGALFSRKRRPARQAVKWDHSHRATTSGGGTTGTGGLPIENGLALLLHMDEADWSGVDSVMDASGNANHGTVMGEPPPHLHGACLPVGWRHAASGLSFESGERYRQSNHQDGGVARSRGFARLHRC